MFKLNCSTTNDPSSDGIDQTTMAWRVVHPSESYYEHTSKYIITVPMFNTSIGPSYLVFVRPSVNILPADLQMYGKLLINDPADGKP